MGAEPAREPARGARADLRSLRVDAWLNEARNSLAQAAGVAPERLELSDEDVATLLELARVASHESGARTNAPLLCYLVGRAQGAGSLEELAAAVTRSSS